MSPYYSDAQRGHSSLIWSADMAEELSTAKRILPSILSSRSNFHAELSGGEAAAVQVIDRIGAGVAQIADGLIGGFGHIDGGEFPGAQQAGQTPSVTLVGFEGRPGLLGNERRCGHQARHLELLEATGDAETAGAGFVGDLQGFAGVRFADAGQGLLEGVQVVGDRAKEADLALGTGLGDGKSDGSLCGHQDRDRV